MKYTEEPHKGTPKELADELMMLLVKEINAGDFAKLEAVRNNLQYRIEDFIERKGIEIKK